MEVDQFVTNGRNTWLITFRCQTAILSNESANLDMKEIA